MRPARSPPNASRSICRPRATTGFLPDLDALDDELLARTVAFYLASPSNPQGAVADSRLSRRGSSRWRAASASWCSPTNATARSTASTRPPACWKRPAPDFANVVVFHSLSKRSNLPGLRVGFAAGDRRFLAAFLELRNVAAPQVPVPAQEVAVAAYGDEAHVEENRELYSAKFDLADQIIGDRYGYQRPAGGFFLWLDVAAIRRQRSRDQAAVARGRRARHARPLSRARAGRRHAIPARATSASPWCRTRRPRPRRCIASSPCWARGRHDMPRSTAASTPSLSSPSTCATSCGGA